MKIMLKCFLLIHGLWVRPRFALKAYDTT